MHLFKGNGQSRSISGLAAVVLMLLRVSLCAHSCFVSGGGQGTGMLDGLLDPPSAGFFYA